MVAIEWVRGWQWNVKREFLMSVARTLSKNPKGGENGAKSIIAKVGNGMNEYAMRRKSIRSNTSQERREVPKETSTEPLVSYDLRGFTKGLDSLIPRHPGSRFGLTARNTAR